MEDLRKLLKVGRVVEIVSGEKYFVLTDRLIGCDGWLNLNGYSEVLESMCIDFNIAKVFDAPITRNGSTAWHLGIQDDYGLELVWKRPKKKIFSDDEIIIAKNIDEKYEYIARDKDGNLYAYVDRPFKEGCGDIDSWSYEDSGVSELDSFNHLYQQIQFEDEEPTLISDIINSKNCQ